MAAVEDVGDLPVHQDHAFLLALLLVPLVDPLLDLLPEGLSDDAVDDVGDVAPGQLQPLPLENGQGHHHLLLVGGVL